MLKQHHRQIAFSLGLASLLVALSFAWQGRLGFNLWDEGFLWYGAQRVMAGEVPIRDFMAYDPGRYYWSASLMSLVGDDGIVSLRIATAIFQALGLCVGLLLVRSALRCSPRERLAFLGVAGLIIGVWMFPRHKLFDASVSLFLLGALALLAERPQRRTFFLAGLSVGLAAVVGRNHALYGLIGNAGAVLWLHFCRPGDRHGLVGNCITWAGGCLAGTFPVLVMLSCVPGFAPAFVESIRLIVEQGSTNLGIPVPWPWTVPFAGLTFVEAGRSVLIGLFFLALPVFAVLGLVWCVLQKRRGRSVPGAFVAAAFLALPYAHFAYSRADVGHLAQGIFPLLIGLLTLIASIRTALGRWLTLAALLVACLWAAGNSHPGWQCRPGNSCANVEVSGSQLMTDPRTASDVALLRALSERYASDSSTFVATPYWPGSYALLERRSPLWEVYALFPRTPQFEAGEIARIKAARPAFVIVFDYDLDGRPELSYRNTHPVTNRYIEENFVPVESPSAQFRIYTPKGTAP